MTITIVKLTKLTIPSLPFKKAAVKIMGVGYKLGVVFATEKIMRKLNRTYRRKNKNSNVLSFSLSKNEGEIIFEPAYIKKEAKKLGASFKNHLWFLFIHSLLHLKGYRHEKGGKEALKMDRAERRLLKAFPVK